MDRGLNIINYLNQFCKYFAVSSMLISKIFGIDIGFVDNSSTYTQTFSEDTQGTIQLEVSGNSGTVNFNFLMITHYPIR